MYARAGELVRDDNGNPITPLLASAKVLVVDIDTGERLGSAYEADTRRGFVSCFKVDENGFVAREPRTLPSGETLYDLVVLRKTMNFDLVNRETGEVIAEYRRKTTLEASYD